MGTFITQTALVGDLTNAIGSSRVVLLFNNGAGSVDQNAVDFAIYRAEAIINSKVDTSFAPYTAVPPILKTIAISLATYFAYDGKPEFYTAAGFNPVQRQFDMASKLLDQLHSGEIMLDGTAPQKAANCGGVIYAGVIPFIVDPDEGTTASSGF